ncbi:hypothetical protein KC338_g8828 [Hortaea werneckii]|nr:hypothetical protein KC338_g8828 [Hortaea werneckii]
MGGFDPTLVQRPKSQVQQNGPNLSSSSYLQAQFAFHNQLYSRDQPLGLNSSQYGVFDTGPMAQALPQSDSMASMQRPEYEHEGMNVLSSTAFYHMQDAAQYGQMHGMQRPQPQGVYQPMQPSMNARQPGLAFQPQGQYPRMDMYGYPAGAVQHSPIDPRFNPTAFAAMSGPVNPELATFARRASEIAHVPSYPRGPPRKPKQSGHALWVGNLPPAANVTDLKDHFSHDATKDIESLFLISKSNCAFVNYRAESACIAAMNRFHDSRFQGVQLVCRLRRAPASTVSSPAADGPASASIPSSGGSGAHNEPKDAASATKVSKPLTVGHTTPKETADVGLKDQSIVFNGAGPGEVPERFFILKSLTVQDLEASVRNGMWATQSHNEEALNKAYESTENVYLIFSANKSGEYFGCARMASRISGEPVSLGSAAESEETKPPGIPQSIPTPASETAPKGHIVDDSARGTIFWEADLSDAEAASPTTESGEGGDRQNWSRQFKIEWVSTARLPFFCMRGLRNPWNANREVKIARDGTELEPGIGRKLVQIFHRPPPHAQPAVPVFNMHYS